MKRIVLTLAIALAAAAGGGCKIFCRGGDSRYRPDLPVAAEAQP